MSRVVVLLRGVNLVKRNRISMPDLRTALTHAGFADVATYVQSGNVVLTSRSSPEGVASKVKRVIADDFGLDIVVLARSRAELAAVVRSNPLAGVATNPRRYLVTFLSREVPPGFADELAFVAEQEPFAIVRREVYSWHPDGIGRTPLWERLASRSLGIDATSRNWTTVTTLLAMAERPSAR